MSYLLSSLKSVYSPGNWEIFVSATVTGLILTLCVGLVVIGGIKRIAKVSEIVVPFMAVLYVALGAIIIITNIKYNLLIENLCVYSMFFFK